MADKCVTFYTTEKLNCPNCFPVDAVLCVPPEILNPPDEEAEHGFIDAVLVGASTDMNSCGSPYYAYKFEFDDEQIMEGVVLSTSNIEGAFCKTCLELWIEHLIGEIT